MPSKNSLKTFTEECYFHVYNRGVEKRRIFEDRDDYSTFLKYLDLYLSPHDSLASRQPPPRYNILKANLSEEVKLLAFCLMPNHFHLLLHQKTKGGISKLMKQLATAYSMYFNKRYQREGTLFQGVYKGCMVESEQYLLHLSRYIHQNPSERSASLTDYPWSSYIYYINNQPPQWLDSKTILDYFNSTNPNLNYQNFVENDNGDITAIGNLLLEN